MATKTWQVTTLQRELADGCVNRVVYNVTGTDGTYSFRANGEVDLSRPETLIPYADLTEEQVISWVKGRVEELAAEENSTRPTVAQIEAAVEKRVTEQSTPTVGLGKPWT